MSLITADTDYPPENGTAAPCCGFDAAAANDTNTTDMSYDGQLPVEQMTSLDVESMMYFYLWTYVTPSLFAVIMAIGTFGNLLVIYVIMSRREMRSTTNLLLVNLAFADVAFLWICVPFTAYKYAADSWIFGDAVCKIFQYFLYVSAYVTIYTLVAISGLRYLTVVSSGWGARLRKKSNAVIVAVAIWICILTANIPTLLAHTVKSYSVVSYNDYIYCGIEQWAIAPMLFSFFVVGYVIPLTAICALYLLIVIHLNRHQPTTLDQTRYRERTSRTLRVVVLVVLVFGISWLPTHVQFLAFYFGSLPEGFCYEVFRVIWNCMAYGNSCANPLIYHYGSKEFRKCFGQTFARFGCWCCCKLTRKKMREAKKSEFYTANKTVGESQAPPNEGTLE